MSSSVFLVKNQLTSNCVFVSVHWLEFYCLFSFPCINCQGKGLSDRLSGGRGWSGAWSRGVTGLGRIAICNLWSILDEVAVWYEREVGPTSVPPPLLSSLLSPHPSPVRSFLSTPLIPGGSLVSPEGRTCCRAGRQFSGWLLLLSSRPEPHENKLTKQRTAN